MSGSIITPVLQKGTDFYCWVHTGFGALCSNELRGIFKFRGRLPKCIQLVIWLSKPRCLAGKTAVRIFLEKGSCDLAYFWSIDPEQRYDCDNGFLFRAEEYLEDRQDLLFPDGKKHRTIWVTILRGSAITEPKN